MIKIDIITHQILSFKQITYLHNKLNKSNLIKYIIYAQNISKNYYVC